MILLLGWLRFLILGSSLESKNSHILFMFYALAIYTWEGFWDFPTAPKEVIWLHYELVSHAKAQTVEDLRAKSVLRHPFVLTLMEVARVIWLLIFLQ